MDQDSQDKPSKGYGKRPMWQWVLLYVIVAIILYGLVYYFFIRKTGNSTASHSIY